MSEVRRLVWTMESAGTQKVQDAITKINTSVSTMSESLKEAGKKATDIGKGLTAKLTLPLVGVGTAGVKMALDVDTGLHKVMTLADKAVLPMKDLQSSIKDMSNESGIAQQELLEATYEALSSGVETSDVLKFVRSGVDLTRAGFTDMTTAIDATTTVLNAYGDDAFDITKIHDIFVQTQDKGKISVDELGKSIGRVIPVASSLGVNVDQIGAGYAMLTARGQNARIATTNLNAMFTELGSTGSNVDKVIRSMSGKSFAQLTEEGHSVGDVLGMVEEYAQNSGLTLNDMFGSMNAGAAATTLLSNGVAGFNAELQGMHDAAGVTQKNAEEMETDALKLQKAMNSLKNAAIEIGAILIPVITKIAEKISDWANKLQGLDDEQKEMIVKIGAVVASIGPMLLILGKVMSLIGSAPAMISNLGTVFGALTSPIGLIIIAVGAFIGVIIHLLQTNEEFRDKMVAAWGAVQNIIQFVGNEMWAIKEVIGLVVEFFVERVQRIAEIFANVVGLISALISGDWAGVWEHAKGVVSGFLGFMLELPKKMLEIGKSIVVNFAKGLKGFGEGLWNKITGKTPEIDSEGVDGSHRTGLPRVPYDGYVAELHRGEEVLTASDPRNRKNASKGAEGVRYNPTYNIAINGDASSQDERKLQRVIERIIEKDRDIFFKKLALSRGVM